MLWDAVVEVRSMVLVPAPEAGQALSSPHRTASTWGSHRDPLVSPNVLVSKVKISTCPCFLREILGRPRLCKRFLSDFCFLLPCWVKRVLEWRWPGQGFGLQVVQLFLVSVTPSSSATEQLRRS